MRTLMRSGRAPTSPCSAAVRQHLKASARFSGTLRMYRLDLPAGVTF